MSTTCMASSTVMVPNFRSQTQFWELYKSVLKIYHKIKLNRGLENVQFLMACIVGRGWDKMVKTGDSKTRQLCCVDQQPLPFLSKGCSSLVGGFTHQCHKLHYTQRERGGNWRRKFLIYATLSLSHFVWNVMIQDVLHCRFSELWKHAM